jgi:site-specific recombinase XerC
MIDNMILRGMSEKTQNSYVRSVAQLASFYNRSPDQISDEEVQAFLLHLIRTRKLSWSSCNVAVYGLRFFYHHTLNREKTTFHIPGPRKPSRLPEILSREEVARILSRTSQPRDRALLMTVYSAGLRVSEVVHLQLQHIDSDRMTIRVEQGKGAQDRYTLLSNRTTSAMALPAADETTPHGQFDRAAHLYRSQEARRNHQIRKYPCAASCLCNASTRVRDGPSYDPTTSRTPSHQFHDALPPPGTAACDGALFATGFA